MKIGSKPNSYSYFAKFKLNKCHNAQIRTTALSLGFCGVPTVVQVGVSVDFFYGTLTLYLRYRFFLHKITALFLLFKGIYY